MKKSQPQGTIHVSVRELSEWLRIESPAAGHDTIVTGFASLQEARSGDLSFFSDQRYRRRLADTMASVVLVPIGCQDLPSNVIAMEVPHPSAVFEKLVDHYGFQAAPPTAGIHPTAVVGSSVEADRARISVGAHAVIDEGARLGTDVEIGAGCFVGRGASIGSGSKLFPNVTVLEGCAIGQNVTLHSGVVIGGDGFGYEFVNGKHRKIRQAGIVQIDDDVEIGANTTVDRARVGRTWIGEGTKIDNQVQIAHNVVIGKHCIVVAGVGIAGSAQIGDYVVIAAQAGIAGHIEVGAQCTIGARCGVTKNLPPRSGIYMGFPAVPAAEERRRVAASRKVPELLARVRKLERANQKPEAPEVPGEEEA